MSANLVWSYLLTFLPTCCFNRLDTRYISCGCNFVNNYHCIFAAFCIFTTKTLYNMKLPSIVTSYILKYITLNILGVYLLKKNYILLKILLILMANMMIPYIMRMKRNYRIIILIKIFRKKVK